MNVISFSLYGSNPKYYRGMVENIKLRPRIYPEWICWIYCDHHNAAKLETEQELRNYRFDIKLMPDSNLQQGLLWRFKPAFEHNFGVERVIVRDADSRINWRERAAVEQWIDSGKYFHFMRDHVDHTLPIMGGMWGCITEKLLNYQGILDGWENIDWDGDQRFLNTHIWPVARHDCVAHDRFPEKSFLQHGPHDCRPFPTDVGFIGEQIP